MAENELRFRIGKGAAVIPLIVFIVVCIALSFLEAADLPMMIAAGVIGIMVGMFFAKSVSDYWDQILTGMGSKLAMTAVMIWLMVGIYSAIIQSGAVVEGLAWLGHSIGMEGALFTVFTFVASAIFAVATGTGFGTIAAMGAIMFPAGLLVNADPIFLAGAILSGAAFGDNIAPVSDTTIISASSQEYTRKEGTADIGGVIRSRFKYAIIAAIIAVILFAIVGGGGSLAESPARMAEILEENSNPRGLLMLISAAVVVALAVMRKGIFVALTGGIITAIAVGIPSGLFGFSDLIRLEGGSVVGAVPNGISGMFTVSILLIVVVTMGQLLISSGCMGSAVSWISDNLARSPRSNEISLWGITTIFNILIAAINTIAIITVAPFTNAIGKRHKLHPYRRANITDATSCTWPFFLPWGGCILLLIGTMEVAAKSYEFVTPLEPNSMFFAVFYSWALWVVMGLAAATGFGRTFEGEGGRRIEAWYQNEIPEEAK